MREIIVFQLGCFGNKVGTKFWELMDQDCNTDEIQNNLNNNSLSKKNENLNSVYYNIQEKQIFPRSIQVDIGQDFPYSSIQFNPYNQFCLNGSNVSNFAQAQNFCKLHFQDIIMDTIRNEMEACDSCQGFQFIYSSLGGIGTGLASLISEELSSEYNNLMQQASFLLPSINLKDYNGINLYNTILCLNDQIKFNNSCITYDNEGIYNHNIIQKNNEINLDDVNHIIATSLCMNSSSLRKSGYQNCSLKKLIANLTPQCFQKYQVCSITNNNLNEFYKKFQQINEDNICYDLFNPQKLLSSVDLNKGKYLSSAINVRGKISNKSIDYQNYCFVNTRNGRGKKFVHPNSFLVNICTEQFLDYEFFGSAITNTTAIVNPLQSICDQIKIQFTKKAFFHKFIAEGLEEQYFTQIQNNILDLISKYQGYGEEPSGENENYYE